MLAFLFSLTACSSGGDVEPDDPTRVGFEIPTANEPVLTANEFTIVRLRADEVVCQTNASTAADLVIAGTFEVHRHSGDPLTFDLSALFFEVRGMETEALLPSSTTLPHLNTGISHVDLGFRTIVTADDYANFQGAYPEENAVMLTVQLATRQSEVEVNLPQINCD